MRGAGVSVCYKVSPGQKSGQKFLLAGRFDRVSECGGKWQGCLASTRAAQLAVDKPGAVLCDRGLRPADHAAVEQLHSDMGFATGPRRNVGARGAVQIVEDPAFLLGKIFDGGLSVRSVRREHQGDGKSVFDHRKLSFGKNMRCHHRVSVRRCHHLKPASLGGVVGSGHTAWGRGRSHLCAPVSSLLGWGWRFGAAPGLGVAA